jgi:hypothetical protein
MCGHARSSAVLILLSAGIAWSQVPPPPVPAAFSQIASGGGWKTTLTLLNLVDTQNAVTVVFLGNDGLPLSLPQVITQGAMSQTQTSSQVDWILPPRGILLIESEAPAASPPLVGWARVLDPRGIAGFAIFRQRDASGLDSEGTSPMETGRTANLLMPFDNTGGFVTGAALVNLTSQPVVVNATLRDDTGAQIDLQAVSLPALGHASFVVRDRFPSTTGRRGVIDFQNVGGGAVAGLGLRFSPSGSFTSVPTVAR